MKRLAIALVVIGLLTVSQVTHAANLEEGWYVKIGAVGILGYTPNVGPWNYDWDFTSPLGTVGPFLVTQPDPLWPQRLISVQNLNDVPSGTAVDLFGQLRYAVPNNAVVTGISVPLATNYDATQMQLQVLIHHQSGIDDLLWSQTTSGHIMGTKDISTGKYSIAAGDSLLLRVTTVPEPGSLLCLALPLLTFSLRYRRRAGR